ncbi:MAG: hypothetical protein R3E64_09770 [Halioglobus sp.]
MPTEHAPIAVVQCFSMVPAQVVEVRCQTGKVRLRLIDVPFNQMNVIGVGVHAGQKRYPTFNDAVSDCRPQKARQIGLDARPQSPQCIGAGFIGGEL